MSPQTYPSVALSSRSRLRNNFLGDSILSCPGRNPASVSSFTLPWCCAPDAPADPSTKIKKIAARLPSGQNLFQACLKIFLPLGPQSNFPHWQRLLNKPHPFEQFANVLACLLLI